MPVSWSMPSFGTPFFPCITGISLLSASRWLPVAKSADSIQDLPDQLPESEWVSARHAVEQEDFFVVGVD
jgi:hypothetical protein